MDSRIGWRAFWAHAGSTIGLSLVTVIVSTMPEHRGRGAARRIHRVNGVRSTAGQALIDHVGHGGEAVDPAQPGVQALAAQPLAHRRPRLDDNGGAM